MPMCKLLSRSCLCCPGSELSEHCPWASNCASSWHPRPVEVSCVRAGSHLLRSRRRRPSEGLAHALPGAVPAVQAAHQTATRSLRLAAQLRKSGAVGTPRPSPHPGLRFPTRQALSDRHRPRRLALELRGCWQLPLVPLTPFASATINTTAGPMAANQLLPPVLSAPATSTSTGPSGVARSLPKSGAMALSTAPATTSLVPSAPADA